MTPLILATISPIAIVGLVVVWIIAVTLILCLWGPGSFDNPDQADKKPRYPGQCELVALSDITPPIDGQSAAELKWDYVQVESQLIQSHDSRMRRQISQQMAQCLTEGLPLDVAISQAAYCFITGACQCPTCQNQLTRN